MRVAIVGGTGAFGRALAARLVAADHEVVVGSRDADRARATAEGVGGRGARNEDAVQDAGLVVLAVEAHAALDTARALNDVLRSPLLSVASELEVVERVALPTAEPRSLAERVADQVDVPVAAGLHTLAAGKLSREKPDEDALVCGDDDEAKGLALELAQHLVAGRAIDAGPLAAARALEAMTAVLVNVNRRYKTHAGVRVTGLG